LLNTEETVVTIWGLNEAVPGGGRAMVEEFNRTHSTIEIRTQAQAVGRAGHRQVLVASRLKQFSAS